jgi:hypothetical protein
MNLMLRVAPESWAVRVGAGSTERARFVPAPGFWLGLGSPGFHIPAENDIGRLRWLVAWNGRDDRIF